MVPGSGDGDKIPAHEPGEYVLNKKLVASMGTNVLDRMNFGAVPRFQEGGQVIEYITGDRSHPNYRPDHGDANYHEHLAFATQAQRDSAIQYLKSKGFHIGSVNDGRHAFGSYHYAGLALMFLSIQTTLVGDIAMIRQVKRFSEDVRAALREGGFWGSNVSGERSQLDDDQKLEMRNSNIEKWSL